jgi:hypothetical protein
MSQPRSSTQFPVEVPDLPSETTIDRAVALRARSGAEPLSCATTFCLLSLYVRGGVLSVAVATTNGFSRPRVWRVFHAAS